MVWDKTKLNDFCRKNNASEKGLTTEKAEEVIKKQGENTISGKRKQSFLVLLLRSFCDIMTAVLLASAFVSYIVSKANGETGIDAFIILAIVLLNGIISVIQESKAEKAIEALKSLSSPEANVIRDGQKKKIQSRFITLGDVIILEKGCFVPADGKIIECNGLLTDESPLTGESHSIEKRPGDNVFSGTTVTGGYGKAIVFAVGMKTKVGSIASMLDNAKPPKTPLQLRLSKTSASLGNGAMIICLVIFAISLCRGSKPAETFLTSVSLAVAAIPEGLPAIVTIMLSMGVTDMAKHKAVVKKLPAVETLGCATLICSDKTGTLTQNKMTVTQSCGDKKLLSKLFMLCNRHSSPTENALYDFAISNIPAIDEPIIDEVPFNSEKRIMATLHKQKNGYIAVLKGAPEEAEKYMSEGFDNARIREMASNGLRVLAVGYAMLNSKPRSLLDVTYTPVGFAGMMDIPREEAKKAISLCKKAGIRTVMITGDHKDTAAAVAKILGITGAVHTEDEIKSLASTEAEKTILKTGVFARATPEFKVKIISTHSKHGEVVAMTGDGVNDAPALKNAHIGCAMGKNGTDVAREASDLILTDDNFATIVQAVKLGRSIYANIRRAVHFLISCNIGEIITVFAAMILSLPTPLAAVQILWVNLVTDSLPAIAIGMEKPNEGIMHVPPISPQSHLFSGKEKLLILLEGITIGVLSLTAYLLGDGTANSTMAFAVLSMSQLFHAFNMRSLKPLIQSGINLPLIAAFLISMSMQLSVMLIPPVMKIFQTVPLSVSQWITVFGLSASVLAVGETAKILSKR